MKAIVLARVSTEEQKIANNSLPAQRRRLKDYCNEKGFEIEKIYSFDETAYTSTVRNQFDEMVDHVLGSKEKVVACFDKIDRFSRDIFDRRIAALFEKAMRGELELHFASDNLIIHQQIGAGEKFMFQIQLSLAKYYSDAISDNVKRTIEQKILRGEIIGKAPFGYKNEALNPDDVQNSPRTVRVNQFEAGIVKQIFDLYTTGADSYLSIAHTIRKNYKNIKMSKRKVESIIKQPFYYGEREYKGKLYPHIYEPIISKDIFELATEKREGRVANHQKGKLVGTTGIYRGLIYCSECGCTFTPHPNRHKKLGRNVGSDSYYYCTNAKGYHKHKPTGTSDKKLTEQFAEIFKKIQIPEQDLEMLKDGLKRSHEGKLTFENAESNRLTIEIEKYSNRIARAYEDYLDGSITKEDYDKFVSNWTKKKQELESKRTRISRADEEYYITASYLLDLANRSHELFMGSSVEQKRQIIGLTLQNLKVNEGKLQYEWVKPFDRVFVYAESHTWGGLRSIKMRVVLTR